MTQIARKRHYNGAPYQQVLAPDSAESLARGLGWLSLGIGVAAVLAGPSIARGIGLRSAGSKFQAVGLRELGNGYGVLKSQQRTPWIWGRLGGDAMDLMMLAPALHPRNPRLGNAMLAFVTVAGITALDFLCAKALSAKQALPRRDYRARSGWPGPVREMRGQAKDFVVPDDMREPKGMRWG